MTLRYLAYGSIMGCSSSLNNLFVTFYLDLFLDLPAHVFLSGQFVYMVWNSVNDPVCGWISDRLGQASRNPRQTRLGAIKYGGLLWAVAFFAVWLAPPTSASDLVRFTHFCLATCAYDTMLTLVEVNHSALLAELTSADAERAAFNGYSAVFAGLGSLTSFAGHFFWDRGHMRAFQACCLLIACVCGAVFYWSAEALRLPAQTAVAASAPASTPLKKSQSLGGVVRFVKELTMQRNFWVCVASRARAEVLTARAACRQVRGRVHGAVLRLRV
jgi:Na+/melibiose symporter-like transporter